MSKIRAAAIHLGISAFVVGIIFAIIFFVWYPGPTFQIAGAMEIVMVLVGVDLVLGPLLTLIVYKKDKPSLKFDLSVIALIQITALVYGAYTFYQERPYYMVFVVDRFNLVTEKAIDKGELKFNELRQKPFANTIRVFARRPEGEEFQKYMSSIIDDGKPDLEGRPEYWEPYATAIVDVLKRVRPIVELQPESEVEKNQVTRAIEKYQQDHPRLGFVPIATLDEDMGMLMDMDTAQPIDLIRVNPW